jgi:RNA polymerase sigma factor (sigma-70 family)
MTGDPREDAARRAMVIALKTATAALSREDAADVAQEVALDVLRSLDRLRDARAFDAWVRKIAVRHTMRALRKQRQRPVPATLTADNADVPEAALDRDLMIASRDAFAEALASLPPRQAIALVLRYVQGLTDREIAEALSCRRGTVNALLSRGRATLREAPALKALASAMEVTG